MRLRHDLLPSKTLRDISLSRFSSSRKSGWVKACEQRRWGRRHGRLGFQMTPARRFLLEKMSRAHARKRVEANA